MSAETAIAVVGIGCRFPGADTPARFWASLEAGVLGMRELTDDELRVAGVGPGLFAEKDYVRRIATLAGPGLFAAEFFGVSPAEAELIDPQQRLFLETCWEALEQAGHLPGDGEGDHRVGVFAGMSPSGYAAALQVARARRGGTAVLDHLSLQLGGMADFSAARVAHKLGLRGPSVGVQTACSSSLTAVHYAVLSLLSGECDLALAGGAGLAEPAAGYRYEPGGILSDDGYCRAFDARSSGTAVGSGVGVVALRRLADALADRDPVLAVLRGSAVGNDGARRPGFTAPTPDGPADVVVAALHTADVGADQLCYAEAHGSGTPLGDHVELRGLTDGLRMSSTAKGFCALGSVKVNIGHTGAAAGIAGLIKAVRIAATGVLPPHPLLERPRDEGLLADGPFTLSAAAGLAAGTDRHVLVNSMGLGGTNAAVVLGPPPAARPAGPAPAIVRLRLSARNRAELDDASTRLADELDRGTLRHADVAYTLRTGRRDFAERRVVTAPPERLAAALRLPRPGPVRTRRTGDRRPLVVAADPAHPLCARLIAALAAEVVPVLPPAVPDDVFVLFAGESAETSADSCTLPLTGDTDALEEVLNTAWLHGVRVGEHQPPGDVVRVPLPTYPFPRRRYWALDDLDIDAAAPAPAAGTLQTQVLSLWQELFGISSIGLDDEFGALGGTSLLSVRMALQVQQRHGVLINLHRVGGSRATVRRVAEALAANSVATGEAADGDGALIDADLAAGLGPIATRASAGTDVLLTGATGYVGAFLLHELLRQTDHRVYCLVRADDEAGGLARLAATATRFRLPAPDLRRVIAVPGDLRAAGDVCRGFRDGELAHRVGHILHSAARVVFTEPYRVLRTDNVLPVLELVRWARESGIAEFSQVSTLAATGPDVGTGDRRTERRGQPLDPRTGGYGATKWAAERLLERAEREGLRVRVFRPGLISGATATGACNTRDMLFRLLAAGLAVGAHPLDPRPVPLAPVDVVAEAVVGLAEADGATGRPYHLVDRAAPTLPQLFGLLAEAGHPTEALPVTAWFERVAERAIETGDPVLSSIALYDLDRLDAGEDDVDCEHWQDWLRRAGRHARVDAAQLVRSLGYLAGQPEFAGLVPIAGADVDITAAGESGGHR